MATALAFDFKGRAVQEQRQLTTNTFTQPDWTIPPPTATIPAMSPTQPVRRSAGCFPEVAAVLSQGDALFEILGTTFSCRSNP